MRLYRGVNEKLDAQNGGVIFAKGSSDVLAGEFDDDKFQFGEEALEFGYSASNAAFFHNDCSDFHPTSYVSFTSDSKTAERFATDGGFVNGWVYVVDTEQLESAGISVRENESAVINSHESEWLVNLIGRPHLPLELVVRKYLVKAPPP